MMTVELDEYPDEEWVDDEEDSDDDLLACPACHRLVHEDTQQCPHCGDWITPVAPGERSKRALWAVVIILLVLGLILITIL